MHYISLWEIAEIARLTSKQFSVRPDLRGYSMRAVRPDRRAQSLSVSELAKTICSTHRDIYFAKVARIRPSRNERPWQAEAGTLIHTLLQDIHGYAQRILPSQGRALRPEVLFRRLKSFGIRHTNKLLTNYKDDPRFAGRVWDDLNLHCHNIIFFETLLICSLLTYKASQKTVLATGTDIDPVQEFKQLFDFSAIEHPLSAPLLGLTTPVTPDFLYSGRIIGDIKTGVIDEDTFLMTCVAYALAYEAEYQRPIDFGLILHVGFSPDHYFPIYYSSRIYELDNVVRRKFTILRDRKLKILADRVDPGRQEDEPRCRPCPFYHRCWGAGSNQNA